MCALDGDDGDLLAVVAQNSAMSENGGVEAMLRW